MGNTTKAPLIEFISYVAREHQDAFHTILAFPELVHEATNQFNKATCNENELVEAGEGLSGSSKQ